MFSKLQAGLVLRLVVLVVAFAAVGTAIWWTQAYQTPERAYNNMLVNNLTTTSVTKSELSSSNGRNILQHVTLSLGEVNAARWLVTIQQDGTSVTSESIGTPSGGFLRYLEIQDADKTRDYSPILGVWAKGDQQTSLGLLFSQAVLDVSTAPVPPLGNPGQSLRDDLLEYIRTEHVFTPDFKTVKSGTVNNRSVYEIRVAVRLAPYLRMMQAFAEAYGLTSLQDVDPTQYQAVTPVRLTIAIDKLSHTMVRVSYLPANFVETYSDYGLANPIQIPTPSKNVSELQGQLQKIQQ